MNVSIMVVELAPGVTRVERGLGGRQYVRAWSEQAVDIEFLSTGRLCFRKARSSKSVRVTLVLSAAPDPTQLGAFSKN